MKKMLLVESEATGHLSWIPADKLQEYQAQQERLKAGEGKATEQEISALRSMLQTYR